MAVFAVPGALLDTEVSDEGGHPVVQLHGLTSSRARDRLLDLDLGRGHLQVGEPSPQYGLLPPSEGDSVCYSLGLYCSDVDATVERAVAAGATIREPLATFVSGDRFASIRDPFGVRWTVMSRVEDLSEAESTARVARWAAERSSQSS